MSRIEAAFRQSREQGRAAFVPYITAGDPSPERTPELVHALEEAGADIVELGVPFSDPLADGPVNQRAAERALAAGTDLGLVLELIQQIRRNSSIPLVLFTYFNPIHRMGVDTLARRAAAVGLDGILVTDLAVEEAEDYIRQMRQVDLDTIFLLAPTSAPSRVSRVISQSRGFVYYISRAGVTGDPSDLSESLEEEVSGLRRNADLPVAVGFGISTPEQAHRTAQIADGVVVGSALVRQVEKHAERDDLPEQLRVLAARFRQATRRDRQEVP